MIYCENCANKNGWVPTRFRKLAACEHCGKVEVCFHSPATEAATVEEGRRLLPLELPTFPLEVGAYKPGELTLGQVGHVYEGKSTLGITMKIRAAERKATADGHEPNTEAWRKALMVHLGAMMPFNTEMPLDMERVQRVINPTTEELCDDRR